MTVRQEVTQTSSNLNMITTPIQALTVASFYHSKIRQKSDFQMNSDFSHTVLGIPTVLTCQLTNKGFQFLNGILR
jgi:hypothetical protein